jgi:hypothetical protein
MNEIGIFTSMPDKAPPIYTFEKIGGRSVVCDLTCIFYFERISFFYDEGVDLVSTFLAYIYMATGQANY